MGIKGEGVGYRFWESGVRMFSSCSVVFLEGLEANGLDPKPTLVLGCDGGGCISQVEICKRILREKRMP